MNWSWPLAGTDPDAPVPLPGLHNRQRKIPRNRPARKNYPGARTSYSPQSYPHPHSAVLHRRYIQARARICKPFMEPRNRFPAWRAVRTTLFDVPARQAT